MRNEIYINNNEIISEKDIPIRSDIENVKIKCVKCLIFVELKIFRKSFLETKYICQSCSKRGNNNPFYGMHHTELSKKKIGGSVCDYTGCNNPFYGKQHRNDTIDRIKLTCREKSLGVNNPFYGQTHTKESKKIIIEKNKLYRQNNKSKILETQLKNLGKIKNDFMIMLDDYVNTSHNRKSLSDKYKMDYRTMQSYWLYFNFINNKDLKLLKLYKKLYSNPSKPESDLYELLKDKYGENNTKQNYGINGYYFDICLFNKILVEYDGYYWHKIVKNKNDEIKDNIAKNKGYILYRVEENEKRYVDLNKSLYDIKSLLEDYNLIQ